MEKGVTEITDIVFFSEEKEEEKKKNSGDDSTTTTTTSADEDKNGGLFNTLISGILHQTANGDERELGSTAADDEGEGTAAAGDGGGGLLDNLVSHLPPPLADDAAPATDEASILIHSLVRD